MLPPLILTYKLLVDPGEFLACVHHTDETAEARVLTMVCLIEGLP